MVLVMRAAALAIASCGAFAAAIGQQSGAPPAPATQPAAGSAPQQPATRPSGDGRRDRIAEIVAGAIDKAHGGAQFRMRAILQCDLTVEAGERSLQGKLTMQTNDLATRLDLADGSALVFDGSTCWVAPESNPLAEGAGVQRLLTLRALVAAPFMARDSHVKVSFYRATMVMGADVDGFRIDWRFGNHMPAQTLMGYSDARKRELSVLGCDALGGLLGLPEGEGGVRCVVFTDLQAFEGMLLPTTWWLYDWTEAAGVRGERLATVKIANVQFLRADAVQFTPPGGSRPDRPAGKPASLPGSNQ